MSILFALKRPCKRGFYNVKSDINSYQLFNLLSKPLLYINNSFTLYCAMVHGQSAFSYCLFLENDLFHALPALYTVFVQWWVLGVWIQHSTYTAFFINIAKIINEQLFDLTNIFFFSKTGFSKSILLWSPMPTEFNSPRFYHFCVRQFM